MQPTQLIPCGHHNKVAQVDDIGPVHLDVLMPAGSEQPWADHSGVWNGVLVMALPVEFLNGGKQIGHRGTRCRLWSRRDTQIDLGYSLVQHLGCKTRKDRFFPAADTVLDVLADFWELGRVSAIGTTVEVLLELNPRHLGSGLQTSFK